MSTDQYEKEIIDRGYDTIVITSLAIGSGVIAKKFFNISPPTLKMDFSDGAKMAAYILVGMLGMDYAVKQKWIPPKISK